MIIKQKQQLETGISSELLDKYHRSDALNVIPSHWYQTENAMDADGRISYDSIEVERS